MIKQTMHPELASMVTPATKLIVLIHGLGSDGDDLIALAPYMQEELANYHFFSPHGLEAYDMAPFGRQWFSLQDRNPSIVLRLIKENTPKLAKLIQAKLSALGLTNKDTVILGFSQGTMIGSYLTLSAQEPFNCFVGFSGRVVYPTSVSNIDTPICLIHGQNDSVVLVDEIHKAERFLEEKNIPYQAHILDNLSHSIDARGMQLAIKFIKKYQLPK